MSTKRRRPASPLLAMPGFAQALPGLPKPSKATRAAQRVGQDALAIAMQAPQVVNARLTAMARHGATPNARERREMWTMGSEKLNAMGESWAAMGMQAMKTQQALWFSLFVPGSLNTLAQRQSRTLGEGMVNMASAGLKPVRQRVASNARRLKTKP